MVYEEEGNYFAYERLVPAVETGAVVMMPIYHDRLMEEIDVTVTDTKFLGYVTPDSGVQGTTVSIYTCHIGTYNAELKSEGICEILELDQAQVKKLVAEGKITVGFTLAALEMYGVE